jgi:hypothetical protein
VSAIIKTNNNKLNTIKQKQQKETKQRTMKLIGQVEK